MRVYEQKNWWKRGLFITAVLIGVVSLWYTRQLVDILAQEEQKKVVLWANATKELVTADENTNFEFLLNIIRDNETIPVILVDDSSRIIDYRNLDTTLAKNEAYLYEQLQEMKNLNEPIRILYDTEHNRNNYLYYKNSVILTRLKSYPYYQLSIIALFVLVAYLAFSASRRAEQNQVWVGMSKETAHQLGTPISSLNGWIQLLRDSATAEQETIVDELQHDVQRLEMITERFSKIGSAPLLQTVNLVPMVDQFVSYLKNRTSSKVQYEVVADETSVSARINEPLMQWVLENICKNAIDAMGGEGHIRIHVFATPQHPVIDITDSGKGISKSKFKTVFKPGYTTKKRGWGLGLSLVKRIVEEYHSGKVFVKESSPKGTTFRIVLQH
jgi:signal transduction histidine kinase